MGLDLFNFDFSEENNEMMTDEKVLEQFSILQQIFKENYNSYIRYFSDLPANMIIYLDEFEKRGWIERRGSGGVNILDEYLMHHTPEELIAEFRKKVDQVLVQPDVCWYENVLPVVNNGATPFRYTNNEEKEKIYRMKKEVIKDVTMQLGLNHFLEVPSSRGHKMNPLSSKWSRDNVLPIITELIKPITDYDEMENFFYTHVFFIGRKDWDREGYRKDYKIPPYPKFIRLSPSYFEIACLCEAIDEKTVKLILDYAGSSYGYHEIEKDNLKCIFPKGWSMERYEASLTDEDKELIKQDQKRLKQLHSV